ncbi:MAG: hypothetical protein PVI31_14870 [Gemmatimonadota bacterium]
MEPFPFFFDPDALLFDFDLDFFDPDFDFEAFSSSPLSFFAAFLRARFFLGFFLDDDFFFDVDFLSDDDSFSADFFLDVDFFFDVDFFLDVDFFSDDFCSFDVDFSSEDEPSGAESALDGLSASTLLAFDSAFFFESFLDFFLRATARRVAEEAAGRRARR